MTERDKLALAVREADHSGDAKARGEALRALLMYDASRGNLVAAELLAETPTGDKQP